MSLTAIIYHQVQDISLWTNSTLNNILVIGNSSIRCSVRTNDYLLLINSQPRRMHFACSDWFTQSRLSAHIPWFDLIW